MTFPRGRALSIAFSILGLAVSSRAAAPTDAEIKTHALAFGAILSSEDGYDHSALATVTGKPVDAATRDGVRFLLNQYWGATSREELLALLGRMESGENGHRAGFWEDRRKFVEGRMENYLKVITKDRENGASLFVVATHLGSFNGKTLPITAWDFGRYINLCRWGYLADWLTESEAWDRMLPVARMIQKSYGSWSEFGTDYLLGRNYWNPRKGEDNDHDRYLMAMLKAPPRGLWSTIPWGQSLGDGPVFEDPVATKALTGYTDPDPDGVSMGYVPKEGPLLIMEQTSADPK